MNAEGGGNFPIPRFMGGKRNWNELIWIGHPSPITIRMRLFQIRNYISLNFLGNTTTIDQMGFEGGRTFLADEYDNDFEEECEEAQVRIGEKSSTIASHGEPKPEFVWTGRYLFEAAMEMVIL